MQNVKETLDHVCRVLELFEIRGVESNHLRQAKHDHVEAIQPMKGLLKSLLILDLFDFSMPLNSPQLDDQNCLHLLLFRGCPWLLEHRGHWVFDFGSSRELLVISGWILAENNLFDKHRDLMLQQLFIPKPLKQQQEPITIAPEIHIDTKDPLDGFIQTYRLLQLRQNRLQQLQKRRMATIQSLNDTLQQLNCKGVTIQQLMQQPTEDLAALRQSIVSLKLENESVRHQEIFWSWMESVVEEDKKACRDHPSYGFNQAHDSDAPSSLQDQLQALESTRAAFHQITHDFEVEWAAVSDLLQSRPECQEKLIQLQNHIPRIITLQRRQLPAFEDWTCDVANYCINSLLKQALRPSTVVVTETPPLSSGEQALKLKEIIESVQGRLKEQIREVQAAVQHLFRAYPVCK